MPGVLTRAIYHARSIFAYIVVMLGTSDSRVPFEICVFDCLRIRPPALLTPLLSPTPHILPFPHTRFLFFQRKRCARYELVIRITQEDLTDRW